MNAQINCGDSLDVNVRTEFTCDADGISAVGFRLEITTLEEEPQAALTLSDAVRLRDALTHAIDSIDKLPLLSEDRNALQTGH